MNFFKETDSYRMFLFKVGGLFLVGITTFIAIVIFLANWNNEAKEAILRAELEGCKQSQVIVEKGAVTGRVYDCPIEEVN